MDRREILKLAATAMAGRGAAAVIEADPPPLMLTVTVDGQLGEHQVAAMRATLKPLEKELGIPILIIGPGVTVEAVRFRSDCLVTAKHHRGTVRDASGIEVERCVEADLITRQADSTGLE